MSLRARLSVLLIVVLAGGVLVAELATFVALRSYLDHQVAEQLQQATRTITAAAQDGHGGRDDSDGGRGTSVDLTSLQPGTFVQLRSASGAIELQSTSGASASASVPALPATLPGGDAASTLAVPSSLAGGPDYEVLITPGTDRTVIVAVPLSDLDATLSGLVRIEVAVFVAVTVLAALAATVVIRVGLRPLDAIGEAAADIAAGDLTRRVERVDDRSEIGRLGEALNTMLGQIEAAFADRTASEERVRRFAADASHELRTPLAAVQGFAELFERSRSGHPDDVPRLMHRIHVESARMAALLDDLLLLTRLDQHRPLQRRPVDLGAVAEDAVRAARVVEPQRSIQLVADDAVEVVGDRDRLRQVVDNLLANVRMHTPAGTPVEVVVTTAAADPGCAAVSVVDHGPGVAERHRAAIFERFSRIDPGRSRRDGGSGLGLSIVAAIVAAHEGKVVAGPTAGGGATFRITLPRLGTPEASSEGASPSGSSIDAAAVGISSA